ncbi:hypothetical protein DID80_07945 [Candidatus Marinamargulisbacteria bacterium SCGC AAA071-K20]|nr:hypothetical protein DID80_07945 [Candidatus Marinamargulisbacteria bacterium SCGC AAA071-K20]
MEVGAAGGAGRLVRSTPTEKAGFNGAGKQELLESKVQQLKEHLETADEGGLDIKYSDIQTPFFELLDLKAGSGKHVFKACEILSTAVLNI